MTDNIEIKTHAPGKEVDDFVHAGYEIFKDDPNWIAPLEMDLRGRLDDKKNPLFTHAEACLFTAWRDGKIVGRCSAQIDHEHLKLHKDDTGFFGFLDTTDDQEVVNALLAEAESWLKQKGMKKSRGPFSFTINEEVGIPIDAFDEKPYLLMPYAKPYQHDRIEEAGYQKAMDIYAWHYDNSKPLPRRAERAWQTIKDMPEVKFRSLSRLHMKRDVNTILDIFNDAWGNNWGFIPATPEEAKKMAEDLLLILDPQLVFFAEIDGDPVATCVCLPNLNEVIEDMNGKLTLANTLKLLWRLKVRSPKSARLMMLGIRQEHQRKKKYAALSVAMFAELAKRGKKIGMEKGELGWTLEDNHLINLGIKSMGAENYKTLRIYEKDL